MDKVNCNDNEVNNINIIEQDADGLIRFRPYLRNTFDVQNKLEQLINNENYRINTN